MAKRKCPNCSRQIQGHPNKKFCGQRCKDRYHNVTNPRGRFAHLNCNHPDYDPLSDIHPFDSDNFSDNFSDDAVNAEHPFDDADQFGR